MKLKYIFNTILLSCTLMYAENLNVIENNEKTIQEKNINIENNLNIENNNNISIDNNNIKNEIEVIKESDISNEKKDIEISQKNEKTLTKKEILIKEKELEDKRLEEEYNKNLTLNNEINNELIKNIEEYNNFDNEVLTIYKNQQEYNELKKEIITLKNSAKKLDISDEEFNNKIEELKLKETKIKFYDSLKKDLSEYIYFELEKSLDINLFSYLTRSYNNNIIKYKKTISEQRKEFNNSISFLTDKRKYIEKMLFNNHKVINNENKEKMNNFLKLLEQGENYLKESTDLLNKQETLIHIEEKNLKNKINSYENKELLETFVNLIIFILLTSFFYFAKKTINNKILDEDKRFLYIKILNLIGIIIITIFFISIYIDKLKYAITFIGIIGAALTITLKELILNYVAWLYMMFTSIIKIGDRILINHENGFVSGEIIKITLSKIILFEQINHRLTKETKKAGRVIAIPNNYIFSHNIYNYTYDEMKTMYDLIELQFELDSDLEKIESTIRDIVNEETRKYQLLAQKSFSNLKNKHEIREKNFNPKITYDVENNKILCYCWYVTIVKFDSNIKTNLIKKIINVLRNEENVFFEQSRTPEKRKKKPSIYNNNKKEVVKGDL